MVIAQMVCAYSPYISGIGSVAYEFAVIARDSGHKSLIFTPAYTEENGVIENEQIGIIRIKPFLKYGNGAFIPKALSYLKSVDLVHLHYPFYGGSEIVWFSKIFQKHRFKFIIHYHMDTIGFSWLGKILSIPSALVANSLFKIADAITCANLDYLQAGDLAGLYNKWPFKFQEVPFGIDEKFYTSAAVSLKKNKKNLLFIGGLDKAHYFKGVDVLLEAFKQLSCGYLKLTIVGNGNLYSQYERKAIDLGISDDVKFVRNADNKTKAEILKTSSILILPSINRSEAFGLVLLEAMSSGIPVIASDLPGVRKVFTNGLEGLLVKPGNVRDLTEKISFLLSHESVRITMGISGRKLVEEKYTKKIMTEKLNNIYQQVYNENLLN